MPTPTVINQWRYSDAIRRPVWDNKYFEDDFNYNPSSSKVGGGATSGTAGDANTLNTKYNLFEYAVIGTQTTVAPSLDAYGLNFAMTATNGQGGELTLGRTALSPAQYIIGTDKAFFMEWQFKVGVVGGVNPLIIGFMKEQAFNATLSTYTDFAAIGIVGTSGHLQTETQIGSAGVVTTDTTQLAVNATPFRLKILVDATGNVTYQINDADVTVSVPYQFTNGISVIPFMRWTIDATTTTQVSANYFACGFQS